MRPEYPVRINAQSGRTRWRTSDARTHDTKQQAQEAQARIGPANMVPAPDHAFTFGLYLVLACAAGAIGIVGWQAYTWLRTGSWPSASLNDVLVIARGEMPHLTSVGADRIMQTALAAPLSMVFFAAAVGTVFWLTRNVNHPATRSS